MTCQCQHEDPPFVCPALKMIVGPNAHRMCLNVEQKLNFEAWRANRLKRANAPSKKPKIVAGVGSELKRLLKWFHIATRTDCPCRSRARAMDNRGIAWCESNIDQIVDWLREAARKRKFPFIEFLARAAVHEAIARAKRIEADHSGGASS